MKKNIDGSPPKQSFKDEEIPLNSNLSEFFLSDFEKNYFLPDFPNEIDIMAEEIMKEEFENQNLIPKDIQSEEFPFQQKEHQNFLNLQSQEAKKKRQTTYDFSSFPIVPVNAEKKHERMNVPMNNGNALKKEMMLEKREEYMTPRYNNQRKQIKSIEERILISRDQERMNSILRRISAQSVNIPMHPGINHQTNMHHNYFHPNQFDPFQKNFFVPHNQGEYPPQMTIHQMNNHQNPLPQQRIVTEREMQMRMLNYNQTITNQEYHCRRNFNQKEIGKKRKREEFMQETDPDFFLSSPTQTKRKRIKRIKIEEDANKLIFTADQTFQFFSQLLSFDYLQRGEKVPIFLELVNLHFNNLKN